MRSPASDRACRRGPAVLVGGAVRACVSRSHQVPSGVGGVPCGAGWANEREDRSLAHRGLLLRGLDETVGDSDKSQTVEECKCGRQERFKLAQSSEVEGQLELLFSPELQFAVPWRRLETRGLEWLC